MSCLPVAKRPWIYARAEHSSLAQQHQPLSVNLQSLLDHKYGWMKMFNPSRRLWPYYHCYLHLYTPCLHPQTLQRDEPDTVTQQLVLRRQTTVICTSTENSKVILPRASQFSEMRTAIGSSVLHNLEYRESLIDYCEFSFCTLVISHFALGRPCTSYLVLFVFRTLCFCIWYCILFAFRTWYFCMWYSLILLFLSCVSLPSVFRTLYFKHLTSCMLCLCLVLTCSANRLTLPGFCEFTPIMCSNRGSHGGREEMQVCSRCHAHY
ncbi:hypothetical protein EV401DRAFT_1947471 [Pisolithus croceorrhizus]|nr:hypothetical protein EV401DRAFT_1947471 [Pisolithus croceorrhizus]